jgi:pyridoxal 5''-phosphate synthase, glutaminase subunit Pdx2
LVTLGVLALQGGVREHINLLRNLQVEAKAVKTEKDLENIYALIIPGGESTTISKLLDIFDFKAPILELIKKGVPVLGTCAGLILLSDQVDDKGGFFGCCHVR